MSQENVDLAWRAVRAWNEGGVDALVQYLDAEVKWLAPRESMEPGIYRGHEGVRDYLGRLAERSQSRTKRVFASRSSPRSRKPSKPWGWRSRQCRGVRDCRVAVTQEEERATTRPSLRLAPSREPS